MKKMDYTATANTAARAAVEGLTDDQIMRGAMQDRAYVLAMAHSAAEVAAAAHGVKKAATFFDAFRRTFTSTVEGRQGTLREAAKPVFWGRLADEDLYLKDPVQWTLLSQLQEIRSTRSDVASECRRLIRDAQAALDRVTAVLDSRLVHEQLHPVYDENLGRMGMAADAAVVKLRVQAESTRTMIKLAGYRLPTREELVAAGLLQAEPPAAPAVELTDPAAVAAAAASMGLTVAPPDGDL